MHRHADLRERHDLQSNSSPEGATVDDSFEAEEDYCEQDWERQVIRNKACPVRCGCMKTPPT